jgi:hypothetical protein
LTRDFNAENQKLMTENYETKAQLDKVLNEYKVKTKFYENELKKLGTDIETTTLNLNEQLNLNQILSEERTKLSNENLVFKTMSEQNAIKIRELSEELERSNFTYETILTDSKMETKLRFDQLSKELNAKWSNTLK